MQVLKGGGGVKKLGVAKTLNIYVYIRLVKKRFSKKELFPVKIICLDGNISSSLGLHH